MPRLISAGLCIGLLLAATAFAAAEQIIQQLSANGSRTTRPFTIKDGWEVQWKTNKDLSIFLLNGQGQPLEALSNSKGAGTGSTYHAKGGTYSLKILSNAEWTIAVV